MQFRSLTDMMSVKRTLGGAFSVFGRRRVFRGIPEPKTLEDNATSTSKSPATSNPSPCPTPTSGPRIRPTVSDPLTSTYGSPRCATGASPLAKGDVLLSSIGDGGCVSGIAGEHVPAAGSAETKELPREGDMPEAGEQGSFGAPGAGEEDEVREARDEEVGGVLIACVALPFALVSKSHNRIAESNLCRYYVPTYQNEDR